MALIQSDANCLRPHDRPLERAGERGKATRGYKMMFCLLLFIAFFFPFFAPSSIAGRTIDPPIAFVYFTAILLHYLSPHSQEQNTSNINNKNSDKNIVQTVRHNLPRDKHVHPHILSLYIACNSITKKNTHD